MSDLRIGYLAMTTAENVTFFQGFIRCWEVEGFSAEGTGDFLGSQGKRCSFLDITVVADVLEGRALYPKH
jgi:hypothetical protein